VTPGQKQEQRHALLLLYSGARAEIEKKLDYLKWHHSTRYDFHKYFVPGGHQTIENASAENRRRKKRQTFFWDSVKLHQLSCSI